MEIKIYCILHSKAYRVLSSCNRFRIFRSFVIAFLAHNLDFGYTGLSFSVYVDITDGDCGFFITVDGYLVIINDVRCTSLSQ
jgi:hypothetical protein